MISDGGRRLLRKLAGMRKWEFGGITVICLSINLLLGVFVRFEWGVTTTSSTTAYVQWTLLTVIVLNLVLRFVAEIAFRLLNRKLPRLIEE